MNQLNEQGSYWVANTFIWNWLLLPILPLNELLKQDIASSLPKDAIKRHHVSKILPYMSFTLLSLLLWLITYPGWKWFLNTILNTDDPEMILGLLKQLTPCYAIFSFGFVLNGIFYAIGKTEYLLIQTLLGNSLLVTLFVLYSNGILFSPGLSSIVIIFGSGLVLGTITTILFYLHCIKTLNYKL